MSHFYGEAVGVCCSGTYLYILPRLPAVLYLCGMSGSGGGEGRTSRTHMHRVLGQSVHPTGRITLPRGGRGGATADPSRENDS